LPLRFIVVLLTRDRDSDESDSKSEDTLVAASPSELMIGVEAKIGNLNMLAGEAIARNVRRGLLLLVGGGGVVSVSDAADSSSSAIASDIELPLVLTLPLLLRRVPTPVVDVEPENETAVDSCAGGKDL